MMRCTVRVTLCSYLLWSLCTHPAWPQATPFQCQPLTCSTLTPARSVDDKTTNDCAYRAGNLWWVDYVAGSLAWSDHHAIQPVTVALFDDGAYIDHEDL